MSAVGLLVVAAGASLTECAGMLVAAEGLLELLAAAGLLMLALAFGLLAAAVLPQNAAELLMLAVGVLRVAALAGADFPVTWIPWSSFSKLMVHCQMLDQQK
jgi:hypothetical protein